MSAGGTSATCFPENLGYAEGNQLAVAEVSGCQSVESVFNNSAEHADYN